MKKIKELKKEIQFNCPICSKLYQLLEIHSSSKDKSELLMGKCLNNCLAKWQQILQAYHSKELMVDLDRQDQE